MTGSLCACGHRQSQHRSDRESGLLQAPCHGTIHGENGATPCRCRAFNQAAIPGPMFSKAGISVRQQTIWIDGAKVVAKNDGGWLHVTVETTDDVKGYAVTVNGKDLP